MTKGLGTYKIDSLRRNWIVCRLVAVVLFGTATTLLILLINFLIYGRHLFVPTLTIIIWVMCLGCFQFLFKPWSITSKLITTFLDRNYPQLEESTAIFLRDPDELTLLQRLQLAKIGPELDRIPGWQKSFFREVWIGLAILVMVLFANSLSNKVIVVARVTGDNILFHPAPPQREKILPQISSVNVRITPPAYTGKKVQVLDKFTIRAEEGSVVDWTIETNTAAKNIYLIFNDREQIALRSLSGQNTWKASKILTRSGYYQVKVDGKASDLYQIDMIKDAQPVIHIRTPKQYTYIDAGEKPQSNLIATLNDDHGLAAAIIHATVAKGSGESVKFKDHQIAFTPKGRAFTMRYLFNLPKLNMEPGDELYFYVEATDNHQQKSRTDAYTISIQDTAALLSMDGIVNGSDVKPEYFRSQRQIIMDTEKLLRDKDSIGRDRFNVYSGNIGADQKLLRLRYGKFLGEEDESDVGGPADDDELSKPENFSNAKMILDAITDKHDNAEDATYLDPSTKAQLKATLNEMWKAELYLRMYKPQDALPFEYKALRLLKDLQQKSRSYVAKTTYKPTPLKMEKRLTGDLSKIDKPINRQSIRPTIDQQADLKQSIQVLENIKTGGNYSNTDKRTLQLAKQQLSNKAATQPGKYLKAVSAMNRILATARPLSKDIDLVEGAIQNILPTAERTPQSEANSADRGLSKSYYQNLKRNR